MTSHHYDLTTLYDALRAGLLTWAGIQASQEARYPRCANGCQEPGKWLANDGRELCETCYLPVIRAELERLR